MKKAYRILISPKNKLYAKETKQANIRIARIEDKTILKGGKIQLNMADGTNILLKKDAYKTGDNEGITCKVQTPGSPSPDNHINQLSPHG